MNLKEIKKIKSSSKTGFSSNESFPKIKIDGFYQAIQNTDMLEVVEKIKKEKTKKS